MHTDNAPSLRLFAALDFTEHAALPAFGQIELVAPAAEAAAAAASLRMRRTQADVRELHQRVPPYVENKGAQTSASWLSGGLSQRQSRPRAAPSSGQLRITGRAGRAGRPYIGLVST